MYNWIVAKEWENLLWHLDEECDISNEEKGEMCYQFAKSKESSAKKHFNELVEVDPKHWKNEMAIPQ